MAPLASARLPLSVTLTGIGAAAMLVPAMHAALARDWDTARAFLQSALLFVVILALLTLALRGRVRRRLVRSQLSTLIAAYTLLPAMLAVPFVEAVGNTRFLSGWFEMVSSLTTTGATLYAPERLSDSLHLWRALVGWMGGFLIWVSAVAILAPLNLGGFEVASGREAGNASLSATQITRVADADERLQRFARDLAPIYAGLTLVLGVCLIIAGEAPIDAVCHAMSTLATSGITTGEGPTSTIFAEMLVALFMVFALSRRTFSREATGAAALRLSKDPELRMGLTVVGVLPLLLVLRHWAGAYDIADQQNVVAALKAFWGGVFTTMSFLTTTGWESTEWITARDWSGLSTPGLILVGLSLVGGGVATTAGGVKLLRIYALYAHGTRELEKLVHPNSVGGAGTEARRIRSRGAYIAWIFFMLFALSVAAVMAALSLTGQGFEQSVILTIAALSTTGPLAEVAGSAPTGYDTLGDSARVILAAAMVLGRMETLALIALMNPAFWRN
ncbi:trk system potassium uptake protein TrkH [Tranquillimonas rosea]|uniref:Trk system potassium uptake protein TrkH n=1 Tax=Tranquillimonas rosea TaxID=641238 RepID=A0A1H9P8V6_9RHOB|nr:potassium transporter TrkG [Tranquillimonas rosea]SER44239.1 trk system potassium uptake protein TrkH [Tranquillimonas rosea]